MKTSHIEHNFLHRIIFEVSASPFYRISQLGVAIVTILLIDPKPE